MKPVFNIRPVNLQPKKLVSYRLFQKTKSQCFSESFLAAHQKWSLLHYPHQPEVRAIGYFFMSDFDHPDREDEKYPTYQKALDYMNEHLVFSDWGKSGRLPIKWIDAGLDSDPEKKVDYWIHHGSGFISKKMGFGSPNIRFKTSMTTFQLSQCIEIGSEQVSKSYASGKNTLLIGGGGKGKDMSSLLVLSGLLNSKPSRINEKTGFFTDQKFLKIADRVFQHHPLSQQVWMILNVFGGYDLAMICGAILQASDLKMAIVPSDTRSLLASFLCLQWYPQLKDYLFIPESQESEMGRFLKRKMEIDKGILTNTSGFFSGIEVVETLRKISQI